MPEAPTCGGRDEDGGENYSLTRLTIKPDIQLGDLYDPRDMKNLRRTFNHFTEADFEAALLEAQHELRQELESDQLAILVGPNLPLPAAIVPARHVGLTEICRQHSNTESEESDTEGTDDTSHSSPLPTGLSTTTRPLSGTGISGGNGDCSVAAGQLVGQSQRTVQGDGTAGRNTKLHVGKVLPKSIGKKSTKSSVRQVACHPQGSGLPGTSVGVWRDRVDKYLLDMTEVLETIGKAVDAISSMNNSPPPNYAEEERIGKRNKEFDARFGRCLYQAGQQFTSLQTQSHRDFIRQTGIQIDYMKLCQLLRVCHQLLSAVLHAVPLSGCRLFPAKFPAFLDLLLNTTGLAAKANLCSPGRVTAWVNSLRHVEAVFTGYLTNRDEMMGLLVSKTKEGPPVHSKAPTQIAIIDNLARKTFGAPSGAVRRPRKTSTTTAPISPSQSVAKFSRPRGTQLFRHRTNLARLRLGRSPLKDEDRTLQQLHLDSTDHRVAGDVAKDDDMSLVTLSTMRPAFGKRRDDSGYAQQPKNLPRGLQSPKKGRADVDLFPRQSTMGSVDLPVETRGVGEIRGSRSRRPFSPDLSRIMRRVHNLEVLATTNRGGEKEEGVRNHQERCSGGNSVHSRQHTCSESPGGNKEQPPLQRSSERKDCLFTSALHRIEAIESDFTLLHQKYRFLVEDTEPGWDQHGASMAPGPGETGLPLQGEKYRGETGLPLQGEKYRGETGLPLQGEKYRGETGLPLQGETGLPLQGEKYRGETGLSLQGEKYPVDLATPLDADILSHVERDLMNLLLSRELQPS